MSLLDEARAEQAQRGPGCRAGQYLAADDGELAEAFDAVRANTLDASALERVLSKRPSPLPTLKADTIRRHVRGECTCDVA